MFHGAAALSIGNDSTLISVDFRHRGTASIEITVFVSLLVDFKLDFKQDFSY